MATVKLSIRIKAFTIALAALLSASAHAAVVTAPDNAYLKRGEEAFASQLPGGAFHTGEVFAPGQTGAARADAPSSLCELVDGLRVVNDRSHSSQSPASFPELLEDNGGPVSTGLGYDLAPGLRFQGVGVFDMEENYAFLGPAFTLNIEGDLAITTGMQLPVAGSGGQDKPTGLYYAEFMLLF